MDGLESIRFQDPSLFNALSAQLTIIKSGIPKNTPGTSFTDRCHQIAFQLDESPEIQVLVDIIHKHLGFLIEHIDVLSATTPSAVFVTGIMQPKYMSKTDREIDLLKTLTDIAKGLNGDTGEVTVKDVGIRTVTLTSSMFCVGEYYGDCVLTPEDIAAVMLHELGHAYSCIAYTQTGQILNGMSDQISRYIPKQITSTSVIQVLTDCLDMLKRLRAKNKQARDLITELPETIKKIRETAYTKPELYAIQSYVTGLVGIITATTATVGMTMTDNQSMVQCTDKIRSAWERSADDFAVRMGGGPHLVAALGKIQHFLNEYGEHDHDIVTSLMTHQTMLRNISIWKTMWDAMDLVPCMTSNGYEPLLLRWTEALHNLYGVFADSSVPANLKDSVVLQIRDMQKLIDGWKARSDVKYRQMLYDGLRILTLHGPLAFINYREVLSERYNNLISLSRDMIDNPLFYQGYVVDKILANMTK